MNPATGSATLAWNTYRHFELYYAISGIGAVCHTINPRLFDDQIVYIVNHAADRLLFVDTTFMPLVERLAPRFPADCRIVPLTAAKTMPETALPVLSCYDNLVAAEDDTFTWPEFDERTAASLCYTSGTTGHPKGRALQPSLDGAAHLRVRHCRMGYPPRRETLFARWCRCFTPAAGVSPMPRR